MVHGNIHLSINCLVYVHSALFCIVLVLMLHVTAAADYFTESAKLQFQISTTGVPVTGIATIGNDLFVIRSGQPRIDVYDAETGTTQRNLQLPSLRSQQYCLAACGFHKCLYVSDDCNSCIHKASSIEKNESVKLSKFQVCQGINIGRKGVQITSLVINKDHNLLVACSNVPKLLEYSTDGVLVRQVNLNISNPCHVRVAQLPTGLYGVLHRDAQNYHYMHSVMDTNGEVIKHSPLIMRPRPVQYAAQTFEFGSSCDSSSGSPFGSTAGSSFRSTVTHDAVPSGLTVSRSGTVFIASLHCNEILVLYESGDAFKEESLPGSAYGGALNQPYCVHFDNSKKRLYIGEWGGGRVLCCSAESK